MQNMEGRKQRKTAGNLNRCMVYLRDVSASCELTYVFLASLQRSATAVRDKTISAAREYHLVCESVKYNVTPRQQ